MEFRRVLFRSREARGEDIGGSPEGFYPGDYLKPVGEGLAAEFGDRYVAAPEAEWLHLFKTKTVAAMLDLIRHDLGLLGIHHDIFASEAQVQGSGAADRVEATLRDKGLGYEVLPEAPQEQTPHDSERDELTIVRRTDFGVGIDRPLTEQS